MPLPTPRPNDNRETFLARCMADATMTSDFPERTQRFAVCVAQWSEARGNKEYSSDVAPRLQRVVS